MYDPDQQKAFFERSKALLNGQDVPTDEDERTTLITTVLQSADARPR